MNTLNYYELNKNNFINSTLTADMRDAREKFTIHLPSYAKIADIGCGSGRDSLVFKNAGYQVTALDGSPAMCEAASSLIEQPVLNMLFSEMEFTDEFDGVWACASLLHVPYILLPDIFHRIGRALHEGGIFYCSFKYGSFEGERNGRYFTDLNDERFDALMKSVPEFSVLEIWKSGDVRLGREDEQWLNILMKKV